MILLLIFKCKLISNQTKLLIKMNGIQYYKRLNKVLSRDNLAYRREIKELENLVHLLRVEYGLEPHCIIDDSDDSDQDISD